MLEIIIAQAAIYMNENSSKSHSIFILSIYPSNKKEDDQKIEKLYLLNNLIRIVEYFTIWRRREKNKK